MPTVSIVMAFLNGADYMREAVDSVFAQDFADWELILVDDGSTDSSSEYAVDLAKRHPNIRLVSHPGRENRGLAQSRVLGSDHASGEYLIFLDHDDVLAPDALSSMVDAFSRSPDAAAIFACTRFWAFDRSVAEKDAIQSYYPLRPGPIDGGKMLRDLIRSDHHHPANCSTLYRRDALLSVRDATPPYDGMYEDTALLFKLLSRHDVVLLEKVVSSYRLHARSMSHQAQAEGSFTPTGYNADRQRFLRWVVAHPDVGLDRRSRARLRWTLATYCVEQWLARFNAPRAQAFAAFVFARV